jgi:hypothetical protein
MMIVGLLRTAGVEAVKDGLSITPRRDPAHATYALDLPLLRLEVSPERIAGAYRPKNAGKMTLHVAVPLPCARALVSVRGGRPETSRRVFDGSVAIEIDFTSSKEEIPFVVTCDPGT